MLKERIEKILAEYQLSPSRFADDIGIQRSGVSHILSGRNKPSLELIQKILARYPDISSDWLVQGNGPMKKEYFDPNQTFLFEESELKILESPLTVEEPAPESPAANQAPAATVELRPPLQPVMDNPGSTRFSEPLYQESSMSEARLPHNRSLADEGEKPSASIPLSPQSNKAQFPEKKLEKIVFFYSDKTFVEYKQE
jgi:transcriptional regulator with XRE-family HTH domain